MDNICMYVS